MSEPVFVSFIFATAGIATSKDPSKSPLISSNSERRRADLL